MWYGVLINTELQDFKRRVPDKEIVAQKNERKDFVYHVGGYDDCTEALVILCMGMEQVDVNQQKYMLFKLEKGKIQDREMGKAKMGIVINHSENIFLLQTRSNSYAFGVDDQGLVRHTEFLP